MIVTELIENENVVEFWVGNYGDFDKLAAKVIRDLKEKYCHIKLNLVIPYITAEINLYKEFFYKNYDNILIADIPPKSPKKTQILKCNQYMIDNSFCLIAFVKNTFGGASKTLEYAKKQKNIKIINIAE